MHTKGLKFKNIIKNGSHILRLDVLTKNCKIHFLCTLSHVAGSLERLCREFGVEQEKSKLTNKGFTWEEITEQSWKDYMDRLIPYLELDVISLREVWKKFISAQHFLNGQINISRCVSAPSLGWKYVLKKSTENGLIKGFL